MTTIEERAHEKLNEVWKERGLKLCHDGRSRKDSSLIEAICRTLEAHDAERAAHAQFRQEVSDAVEEYMNEDYRRKQGDKVARIISFILAKPDPLVNLAREMVLLDGVVRTDSQKAAIREGRAANTAADDFYDRLRTALPARGLKLVEVGDAD